MELRVQAGNAFDFESARPTLPRLFKTRKRPQVTMLSEQEIRDALKAVKYPGYSRDIVSFGLVKHVAAKDGAVSISIELTGGSQEVGRQIKAEIEQVLKAMP